MIRVVKSIKVEIRSATHTDTTDNLHNYCYRSKFLIMK